MRLVEDKKVRGQELEIAWICTSRGELLHARLCFAVAYLGLMTMAAMNKKFSSLSPPDQLATKEPFPAAPPLLHAPSPDTQQKPIIATEPQAQRCRGFAMAQPLGTTPTNHQPLVCCSLAHSPSFPAGSRGRSAVSLDAPPRLPDSSDTQPALPKPPRSSVLLCFPIHSDRIRPCGFEPSGLRSVELF